MSTEQDNIRNPCVKCLENMVKMAVVDDKPIMMDYWVDSLSGRAVIGVREGGEKLLVKSEEEYTSPIGKIYKVETEYIILTENSIYVVSTDIQSKRIS